MDVVKGALGGPNRGLLRVLLLLVAINVSLRLVRRYAQGESTKRFRASNESRTPDDGTAWRDRIAYVVVPLHTRCARPALASADGRSAHLQAPSDLCMGCPCSRRQIRRRFHLPSVSSRRPSITRVNVHLITPSTRLLLCFKKGQSSDSSARLMRCYCCCLATSGSLLEDLEAAGPFTLFAPSLQAFEEWLSLEPPNGRKVLSRQCPPRPQGIHSDHRNEPNGDMAGW